MAPSLRRTCRGNHVDACIHNKNHPPAEEEEYKKEKKGGGRVSYLFWKAVWCRTWLRLIVIPIPTPHTIASINRQSFADILPPPGDRGGDEFMPIQKFKIPTKEKLDKILKCEQLKMLI